MEEKDYLEIRKNELNVEAAKMKDRFIDDMLRMFNQFTVNWNELTQKLAALDQTKRKEDKINQ